MQRKKVFITREIPQAGVALLKGTCDVEINPDDRPLSREELLTKVAGADGVIGLLTDKIDAAFFEAAKNLKGYANYAVGYDNIDVAEATRRKIPVSNTPDVLTLATAELAWALIFAVARRVVETDAVMRSGAWTGWGPLQFIGLDVSAKTLGILGAGRIGAAVARIAQGFGMRLVYCNRSPNPELEAQTGARKVSFEELLAQSDFISIHAPLTPETRHLFNRESLSRMKRTAVLVNTGRGPIIKEDDLVWALRNEVIAGAGLDVYEFEPRLAEGLAELKNAVLLPHIGSATRSSRDGMAELAARNLLAMLAGERPPTILNPEVLG